MGCSLCGEDFLRVACGWLVDSALGGIANQWYGGNVCRIVVTHPLAEKIPPTPSTITPTSKNAMTVRWHTESPALFGFTGLQVSVMCGSALPPADHERTNRPADSRMAPPGAPLQRFLRRDHHHARRAPPPHRAGGKPKIPASQESKTADRPKSLGRRR